MTKVFRPYITKFVILYLHDIFIYRGRIEEHIEHILLVLESLIKERLHIIRRGVSSSNSNWCILGFVIWQGLSMNPCNAVLEWLVPRNVYDIIIFHGIANFYSKFIID
jgi:hypothetical protein